MTAARRTEFGRPPRNRVDCFGTQAHEAGRLAPSGMNAQPWRFKVAQEAEDIRWLAGAPTSEQGWVASAAAVIVCFSDTDRFVQDLGKTVRFLRDGALLTARDARRVGRPCPKGPERAPRGTARGHPAESPEARPRKPMEEIVLA
jgi:nitroreductase